MHLSISHGEKSGRTGFTLVEVLIATTISLIMIGVIVKLFTDISQGVRVAQGILASQDRVRSTVQIIQSDLDNCTARSAPPFSPGSDDGFFAYTEGPDGTVKLFPGVEGDSDDILHFTARRLDEPFTGRWVDTNGVTRYVKSNVAEICYFVRDKALYRRVLLVRPGYPINVPANTSVYASNDISVRAFGGSYSRVYGAPSNPIYLANSLGDLTNRQNRFGHQPFAFPYDHRMWQKYDQTEADLSKHLGMPTMLETADPNWVFPAGLNASVVDSNNAESGDSNSVIVKPSGMELEEYKGPYQIAGVRGKLADTSDYNKQLHALEDYHSEFLPAADVLLENVQAFDVKVWDPNAPIVYKKSYQAGQEELPELYFDFDSPPLYPAHTYAGWTSVPATKGFDGQYGWADPSKVSGQWGSVASSGVPVIPDNYHLVDGNKFGSQALFRVAVPNGNYLITVGLRAGRGSDPAMDNITVKINGTAALDNISIAQFALEEYTGIHSATSNLLEFEFLDGSTSNPFGAVAYLKIEQEWRAGGEVPTTPPSTHHLMDYDVAGPGYSGATEPLISFNGYQGSVGSAEWVSADSSYTASNVYSFSDMTGTRLASATLDINVPFNGNYSVQVTTGSEVQPRSTKIQIEDGQSSVYTCSTNQFLTASWSGEVTDKKITIRLTPGDSVSRTGITGVRVTGSQATPSLGAPPSSALPPRAVADQGIALTPRDPGYLDTLYTALAGTDDYTYIVGAGAYVDLNYLCRLGDPSNGWGQKLTDITGEMPSFYHAGNPLSGLVGTSAFTPTPVTPTGGTASYASGPAPTTIVPMASVYDTWSTYYDHDGLNQDWAYEGSNLVTDQETGTEVPPPYPSEVESVLVNLRVLDPKSGHLQSVRIISNLGR